MRVCLDTCVLYPTVMREVLLGVAGAGAFIPIWSERILEEWRRAAIKLGAEGEAQAQAEIALLIAGWPDAIVKENHGLMQRLWLPDANDVHVLATAVAGHADAICTMNAKDFPKNILAEEGLTRIDPDGLLMQCWLEENDAVLAVAEKVLQTANAMSGRMWEMRGLLKKARLPRLAKALGGPTRL